MNDFRKWTTMTELAERVGISISALSKAIKRGRIPATRWRGRVFFSEEQVAYAESLFAHSSRQEKKKNN